MNSDIATAYQVLGKFRGFGNQQVRGADYQLVVQTERPAPARGQLLDGGAGAYFGGN
ncbi:MAG: hypothetical protein HRU17_20815 [Polyangiaceae bacterium]|nr:hypothetical protein [Polyangiaceae bacterium]